MINIYKTTFCSEKSKETMIDVNDMQLVQNPVHIIIDSLVITNLDVNCEVGTSKTKDIRSSYINYINYMQENLRRR